MRKLFFLFVVIGVVLLVGSPTTMAKERGEYQNAYAFSFSSAYTFGYAFMEATSYAYQWFRDDDGDGIPNGQDPDWIRPQDGDGYKLKHRTEFEGNQGGDITPVDHDGSGNHWYHNGDNGSGSGDRIKDRLQLKLQDGSCLD